MSTPEDVLEFWLDACKPSDWYNADPDFDAKIRTRFEPAYESAMDGGLSLWLTYASGTLAYIILTDQLSRNMYRDTGKAFASDKVARAASKQAIARGWDLRIDEPARQFFYMPLVHSECLADQDRAVRLFKSRMPISGASNLLHAQAHREIIRLYGRFPTRNEALGRASTEAEQDYLDNGGYRTMVQMMEARAA